jgi:hypothetical protein
MVPIKYSFFGMFSGALYGFISFALLTNVYRNHIVGLVTVALQGGLLGLTFAAFKLLIEKYKTRECVSFLTKMIIGIISGAVSSLPVSIMTMAHVYRGNSIVPGDILRTVLFSLFNYSLGSILIGIIVSFALFYIKKIKGSLALDN